MDGFFRRALAIARTETRYLLREPRTLMVCFLEPVVLLVIYGFAVSFTLSRVPFAVWDQSPNEDSRLLVRRIDAGREHRTFKFAGYVRGPHEINEWLSRGKARFVLVIPADFHRKIEDGQTATVQALFDAADSNTAGVASGFLSAAVAQHNARLATGTIERRTGARPAGLTRGSVVGGESPPSAPVNVVWRVFYNPDLSTQRFIIPGLMVLLLAILAAMLTSTTITRERELGSLESLLTSPVGPVELVIGKMSPYFLISAVNVLIVLVLGGAVFGVWPRGSVLTLALLTLLFLPGMLSFGVMISSVAPTQQLALVIATLTTYLPTMLLTGFAFPRSNMARFIEIVTIPYPATQYLLGIRSVYLKGAGWSVIWPQALWLAGAGAILLLLAIKVVGQNLKRGLE